MYSIRVFLRIRNSCLVILSALFVAACGGGGGGGGGTADSENTFTISGNVSGLSGSGLVLQLNGAETLPVSANGAFTFTTPLADTAPYTVTVQTQPSGQTCSVSSGSGTISSANVTNVIVTCSAFTFTVGGTVSGLTGSGLVLQLNGAETLPISSNGGFTFTIPLADATPYSVTVQTQPTGQTCSVGLGSGTISSANVTNVAVTCTANTFTVGGTVSGLTGTGLVLQLNGAETLPGLSNGAFTFTTLLANSAAYTVTVQTQPTGQTCQITSGIGTISSTNVTNVAVACVSSVGRTILSFPGDLPATGQILPANSDVLYEITGLTPGTTYTVSTSDATPEETELFVFSDSGFSAALCFGGTTARNEACGAIPTSTSLFIQINNFDGLSTTFTLNVTVGFSLPALAFGTPDLPATGQTVALGATKHFEVTGLTPGTDYIPSIAGNNDIDLWVYQDSGFINLLCAKDFIGFVEESCIGTPTGTSLFVVVADASGLGDTYSVDVVLSPFINVDFGNLPFTGSVDTTQTLVRVTGLAEFTAHTVSLTGLSDDVVLRVWSDPLLSPALFQCLSNNFGTSDESCIANSSSNFTESNNSAELFIQVDGSLTISGTPFTMNVTP